MNKKKVIMIIISVILVLLIAILSMAYILFRERIQAAQSVEKIGSFLDCDIYTMEYHGDYGFERFLQEGGAASSDIMADYIASFLSGGYYKPKSPEIETGDFGCSTISVKDEQGNELFGRNYDWNACDVMIVHTIPNDGYESYSTACLDFLGFGEDWKIKGFEDKYISLAAIYTPLDGMNEKGLCVADLMAGNSEETHQKSDKKDLTTTSSIRLLLDHAANVQEAVALLQEYDMNSDINTAHHISISDANGESVVVEYVNSVMKVTQTKVLTNHYLAEGDHFGIGSENSHTRFDMLTEKLINSNSIMDAHAVKDALSSVATSNFESDDITVWSIVCDKTNLTLEYYFNEAYDEPIEFQIAKQ